MRVEILAFGQITEITGQSRFMMEAADINELQHLLQEEYPALRTIKYILALNKELVSGNTILTQNATVALMPPFSGG